MDQNYVSVTLCVYDVDQVENNEATYSDVYTATLIDQST